MAASANGSFFSSVTVFLLRFSCLYILLISLLFLQVCLALYEDQVGLFDWRQQYIGKVKFAYFDHYSHSSRRALVATESNVIAALNARTGAIVWRKVFEKNQGNVDSLLRHADALVSVSTNGRVLRSWDPGRGHLIWESADLGGEVSASILSRSTKTFAGLPGWGTVIPKKKNGGTFGVLSLLENTVRLHRVKDGSEIWTWKRQASDADSSCLGLQADGQNAYIATLKSEAILEIKILDLTDGKLKQSGAIPAPWVTYDSTKCSFVGEQFLACLDLEQNIFHVIDLKNPNPVTNMTPLNSIIKGVNPATLKNAILHTFGHQYDRAEFILQLSLEKKLVLSINKNNQVELVKEFVEGELVLASNTGPKPLLLAIKSQGKTLNVNVFDLDNFNEIRSLHQTLSFGSDHGRPELGAVYLFSKKDGELGYRIILTSEDYSLCLIQQTGKVLWEREEALSGITSVEMVELPPSASESKLELLHEEFSAVHSAGIISMFYKRVKVQLKQLEVLMASLKKRKHTDQSGLKGNQQLTRDQFNLVKVIIAVTESGKIFALDSMRGNILWTRFLPDLAPFLSKGENKTMLFIQRTSAHFPLPPQVAVIGNRRSGPGTVLFVFNPLTGKPADHEKPKGMLLPYDVLQASSLPFTDERFTRAIILVDRDMRVHIFPDTEESVTHFHEKMSSIYLYLVNDTTGLCRGFVLKKEESLNGRANVGVDEVWSVKIPDDQKILTTVSQRSDEHVHSVGRVLGDRSVLYKYLNPNLIAISTVTKDTHKASVGIYLIDAVTGQIMYQVRHRNAENAVEMVLSENWLVYLYYNSKSRRMEISVVEMYEGLEEKNSTAFSSLDSLDHPLLTLSQGYLLALSGVNAMSVTNTERGITHKNLLLALDSGYVYSLPKNLLDPRRRFDQTAELAEEGLMPYMPELPLSPQAYLNYNMTVEKIRGIHTSAAGLESTSLVLTYGLDLYYTRVTPSRMFDVLKEDFDYIFISGVLSALILGTIISSKLASIRALNLSWL